MSVASHVMNKLLPVVVTAVAAVIAVAIIKLMEDDPLPPQPEGTWELDEDDSPA